MYERILVPVDGSTTSAAGLGEAMKLAKLTGAQLRLLHVVDDMPLAMSAEGYGAMTADLLSLLGEAGQKILQAARERVAAAGIAVDTVIFDSLGGRVCDRGGRTGGRVEGRPDRARHARPARHRPHGAGQRCRAGTAHVAGAGAAGARARKALTPTLPPQGQRNSR